MITEKTFREFVHQRMCDALSTPSGLGDRLKEILDFAAEHKSTMDEGATAYFDKFLDGVATMFEAGLASAADSPNKRKMLRLAALTKGKHFRAEGFLRGLGKPLPSPFVVSETGKPIFLDILQTVFDLLFDASRQKQHGPAQFGSLSLFYWAIDELTVAFYLAERKYTTQSFSHLRTVLDLLDKAELFFQQPELGELWASQDKRQILKQLQPSAVRKRLGKPKFDPIYDFYTERGMHGTFGAIRQRAVRREKSNDLPNFAIWVGGVAWDQEVDVAISSCILSALLTLTTVAKVYETRLNQLEVISLLRLRIDDSSEFLRTYLVKVLQNLKTDASVIDAINELLLNRLTDVIK